MFCGDVLMNCSPLVSLENGCWLPIQVSSMLRSAEFWPDWMTWLAASFSARKVRASQLFPSPTLPTSASVAGPED